MVLNKNLLIVFLAFLLAIPSASAFCLFGIGECGTQIFIFKDVNQTINQTINDVNGISHETFNAAFPISFDLNVVFDSNAVLDGRYVQISDLNFQTVSQIIAGTNITISPLNGIGVVTINSSGGGGGGGDVNFSIDGGFANSVYLISQLIDGGDASGN